MTRCSIWRCKQCGATIIWTKESKIPYKAFDELFDLPTVFNALTGLDSQNTKYTHRCDPQTVGLCEFIGWRKQE